MHHPTDRMTHTTAFVTPVVEHWLEREIAQWVKNETNDSRLHLNGSLARYLRLGCKYRVLIPVLATTRKGVLLSVSSFTNS